MDARRFDNLARLAATVSRRNVLKALLGAAGGGLLTLVGLRPASALPCRLGGAECDGCCSPFGGCRPGDADHECGTGGETCKVCAIGVCRDKTCVACDPTTCDGCCSGALGNCLPGTATSACGAGGQTCQVCAEGETCENGGCVSRVGSRPTTRPDFAYAAVRPTDLGVDDAGNVVTTTWGIYFDGSDAGLSTGALNEAQLSALPSQALDRDIFGFRQTIGLPAPDGAGRDWDQSVTTWVFYFDGSDLGLGKDAVDSFGATYLAGTTPLDGDPAIGGGSAFHAWSGQTSDGQTFVSLQGTFADGNTLGSVRIDDYAGSAPDLRQAEDLLRFVATRNQEIQTSDYQNLGTTVAPLSHLHDPTGLFFSAAYTAYGGTLFRRNTHDDVTFATEQERLTEIDRAYTLTQPLPLGDGDDGPFYAYFATTSEQFLSTTSARSYFEGLGGYLEQDGPNEVFPAEPRSDAPIFPNIQTPANWWDYRRESDGGTLPGVQIALNLGDTVTKLNVRGAVPIPESAQITDAYRDAIDQVAIAAATDYINALGLTEVADPAEVAANIAAAIRNFEDLQSRCLSGSPEQCVTEEAPLVAGEPETESGTETETESDTAELRPAVAFPDAVFTPVDGVAEFGIEPATAEALTGVTFYSEEGTVGAGMQPELVAAVPWERAVAGHLYGWRVRPLDALPNELGTVFVTTLFQGDGRLGARAICHGITESFLAGATEIPNELGFGLETHTYEVAGTTANGQTFSSQIGVIRQGEIVVMLRMDDFTGAEPQYPFWPVPNTGTIVQTEIGIMRVMDARIAALYDNPSDRRLPDYTGIFTSNVFSEPPWSERDFVFESNLVIGNQAIRQFGQPPTDFAAMQERYADVVLAYRRTDFLTLAGAESPLILNRLLYTYADPAAAEAAFGNLPALVAESAGVEGLDKEYDPAPEGFPAETQVVRYVRGDTTGQTGRTIGQESWLWVPGTSLNVIVHLVAPRRFAPDATIGQADIDPLAAAARVFVNDYALSNDLIDGLTEDDRQQLVDDLRGDWDTFMSRYSQPLP